MNSDHGAARSIDRRTALAGAVALAGAAGLAACSSSSTSGSPATSGAATSGGAGTAGSGSSGSSGATGASGKGTALAKLDSIPVGKCVSANLGEQPVIVARPTATTAVCFSAICTHMGCTVAPAGTELHCPCHGSVYSATTGKVLGGPAPRPLPKIPVDVTNGEVVVKT
jgi:Rieske Fe-S protein